MDKNFFLIPAQISMNSRQRDNKFRGQMEWFQNNPIWEFFRGLITNFFYAVKWKEKQSWRQKNSIANIDVDYLFSKLDFVAVCVCVCCKTIPSGNFFSFSRIWKSKGNKLKRKIVWRLPCGVPISPLNLSSSFHVTLPFWFEV